MRRNDVKVGNDLLLFTCIAIRFLNIPGKVWKQSLSVL